VAYSCVDGYFFTEDYEEACTSCTTVTEKCASCSSTACLKCALGYRLDVNTCVECPKACETCDAEGSCTSCPFGTVTSDKTCVTSALNLKLVETTPVAEAAVHVDQNQVEMTNSSAYPIMGQADDMG
jgi:hypothetical protein